MAYQQRPRRKKKITTRAKKKDPLFVDGSRPRPMYVDYKDVELLKKLVNRHGKIVGRRKTGCTAVSQHAVSSAIKRARFMGLLSYTGDRFLTVAPGVDRMAPGVPRAKQREWRQAVRRPPRAWHVC